uniref:Uncharacterized protein n=1 Tax=viral metagenome TaxID=1070528 RepID=A0A6C0C3U0_9ZZZZ
MSQQKTIQVSPELMAFSRGKTAKKRKEPKNEIKVKNNNNKKNDTLKRQSLLRMIRKHQEDKYKEYFSKDLRKAQEATPSISNFENSKAFLQNIQSKYNKNETFKNTPSQQIEVPKQPQNEEVAFHANVPNFIQQPKYGCLKNGNLPTYRTAMNKTQKQVIPINNGNSQQTTTNENNTNIQMTQINALRNYNEKRQAERQKRVIRKTFNLGKQKTKPVTTVLVSNKKVRANITMKIQNLKQIDINKIKKDLLKRGLIRVGTITPESVLRKMYETVHSMCGSVQNHNPDNLLYNYLNGGI